jgi:hypothetical protein
MNSVALALLIAVLIFAGGVAQGNSINDFHEGFVDRILDVTAGGVGALETSLENAESTDATSGGGK